MSASALHRPAQLPAAHFMLNRTFENRAMTFSYTLALTRACVSQFAPATATAITALLKSEKSDTWGVNGMDAPLSG